MLPISAWFEIEPCYVYHPLNAYDAAGATVVLDATIRLGRAHRLELDATAAVTPRSSPRRRGGCPPRGPLGTTVFVEHFPRATAPERSDDG